MRGNLSNRLLVLSIECNKIQVFNVYICVIFRCSHQMQKLFGVTKKTCCFWQQSRDGHFLFFCMQFRTVFAVVRRVVSIWLCADGSAYLETLFTVHSMYTHTINHSSVYSVLDANQNYRRPFHKFNTNVWMMIDDPAIPAGKKYMQEALEK